MKKALMFVLFLSILINSQAKKQRSLIKRINKAFRMFEISEFIEEYEPSKYAGSLYDANSNVQELSVKIKMVKDFLMSVLDYLTFDDTTIQKLGTAKVSVLMDAMDVCVNVAKGDSKALGNLKNVFPDISTAEVWTAKLGKQENVNNAVEFIKDTIHPESVVNAKSRRKYFDEINESSSEEEFDLKEVEQNEEDEKSDEDEEEKEEEEVKVSPPSKNKKSHRKMDKKEKFGDFHEVISVPFRKSEKKVDENLEDEFDDIIDQEFGDEELEAKRVAEPKKESRRLAFRKAAKFSVPNKGSPRFLTEEELKEVEKVSSKESSVSNPKLRQSSPREEEINSRLNSDHRVFPSHEHVTPTSRIGAMRKAEIVDDSVDDADNTDDVNDKEEEEEKVEEEDDEEEDEEDEE